MSQTVSQSTSASRVLTAKARTQRTLNVPFLIGSLLLFAAVGGGAYFLRNWQIQRTAVVFVARADELEAEEKWISAAEYLNRYLQLAPEDHTARIRLARTYKKGVANDRQRQRAIDLHFRAIGTGVKEEELSLRQDVGTLLLGRGQFIEAEQEAAKILALTPGDAIGLRMRAVALTQQYRNGSLAREQIGSIGITAALREAFQANADDIELAGVLAFSLRDKELATAENSQIPESVRHAEADACLERLVQARPQDAQAYLARYVYKSRFALPGAAEDLVKAKQFGPRNVAVLKAAAQAAHSEGVRLRQVGGSAAEVERQLTIARDLYQRIIDENLANSDPAPQAALGEVQSLLGDSSAALNTWRAGLAKFKKAGLIFQTPLASLYLDLDRFDEAEESLDALDQEIAELPPSIAKESRLLLQRDQDLRRGLWHVKRKQPQQAIPLLRLVILRQEQLGGESEQSVRAWLLLGGAYASLGEWAESGTSFDRAAVQQPKLAFARLGAAISWLAANRSDLAVERADQAVQLAATGQATYTLAAALFHQQSALPERDRLWARLEKALDAAQERAADGTLEEPWRIDLLHADYLLAKGNATDSSEQGRLQALEVLRQAGSKYPLNTDFWKAVAIVYQHLGQPRDADTACERLGELPGGESDAVLVRTRVLTLRGEYDLAEKTLLAGVKRESLVSPQAAQRELINVKLARRDYPAARALLLKALEQNPRDLAMLRRVADIDLDSRRLDDVANWEQKLQSCGGMGIPLAHYFRVRRLMLEAKSPGDPLLTQAADEAAVLYNLRPTSPEIVSLKGLVDERLGRIDSAIMAFEQAIELGEQRVAIFERLIALLDRRNRSTDAEKYLSRLKSHVPFSHDLTAFESTVEIRKNQPGQAVAVAQRGVERRPDDPSAHIWLGRMLLVDNQREPAEKAFKRAVELDPENVHSWNGLFSFYIRSQAKEKARETLGELGRKVKLGDAERNFVLAQGYEFLGDQQAATDAYAKATSAAPQNTAILLRMAGFYLRTNPEESQRCLRKVLRIDPNSGEARRTLAAMLAARGTDADWDEVKQLVMDSSDGAPLSSLDNRLSAMLLIQRGGPENFTRAMAILEDLVSRADAQIPADRLMLAQLYEKQARIANNPEEAKRYLGRSRDQYIALCASSTPQLEHVTAFMEYLIRQNDKSEGVRWLQKYGTLVKASAAPAPALTSEFVRLALALGEIKQAEEWQVSLEKSAAESLGAISLRVRLMAQQGKSEDIEAFLDAAGDRLLAKANGDEQRAAVLKGVGAIYASVQILPLAERWFRRLHEQLPTSFEPLARVVAQQGRISESLEICTQAADANTNSHAAIVVSSIMINGKATPAEAEKAEMFLKTSLGDFPKDTQLLFSLGTLRIVQGRINEAIALLREVVALQPRHVAALNNLATLLSEDPAHRKEALGYINQAINITGTEAALFDTKGTILLFDGQSDKAVEFLRAAVDGPDADPRYRFHLALAYNDLKDIEQARNELAKSLEQDLEKQILTPKEQRLLSELRSVLTP